MAVAVEGTPTQFADVSVVSLTWSHTAGGDGLFVGVGIGGDPLDTVDTVTFNGDSLTEKWEQRDTGASTYTCAGYLMVAPDAGAHNVVATFSRSQAVAWGGAVGLSGLHQTTPNRTVYKAADKTITVVDSQSGDLVIDCCVTYNLTIAVGAGQTSQIETDSVAGGNMSIGISTEPASGASTVMSWTAGDYNAIGAMALVAAAGGSAPTTYTHKTMVFT